VAEKLKGLLDSAKARLTGLLGDFPQGFNAGAVAGFPGWAGDMAYMADTARLALTGADQQAAPENYVGTTDYIAKQAGYPVPQTLSGQLGAAVGGLMSPGPGDLAKFAPVLSAIPFWHGSRTDGSGTHNIVMFDDKGIKLLERNGTPIEDFAARRAGKAKPYKEAVGVDTIGDMNNKSVYHRATQSADSPMQGAGYAMFADGDPARVDGYGEHRWVASGAGAVDVGDIQKDIVRALRNSRYEWEPEYQATAASLAREANPDDIVNSAGIWDSPRLVDIIYRDVLEPRGIKSVRTNDGLIIFDPRDAKAVDGADGM